MSRCCQIGLDLRFDWNGELHESRMLRGPAAEAELRATAEEKRRELEAKGWMM